jgi:hypothetical protein
MSGTEYDDAMALVRAQLVFLEGYEADRDALSAGALKAQADVYAALADLRAEVAAQLTWTVRVDQAAAGTAAERAAGVYKSLADAIAAAPALSTAIIELDAGTTHDLTESVPLVARSLTLTARGGGEHPVVALAAITAGGANELVRFETGPGFERLRIYNVDLRFPVAPAGVGGWRNEDRRVLLPASVSTSLRIEMVGASLTGGVAGTLLGIATCLLQDHVAAALRTVSINGPLSMVLSADDGIVGISRRGVTLSGGAALTQGGTVGVNHLITA